MRKALVSMLAVAFLLSIPVMASAFPITFTDTVRFGRRRTFPDKKDLDSYGGGSVRRLGFRRDHLTWTHHFPMVDNILSGELTVWFTDDEKDRWPRKGKKVKKGWRQTLEWGQLWAEDGTYDWGEVDTGPYSYDIDTSFLTDGEFQVTVRPYWHKCFSHRRADFKVVRSDLEITYEPASVPEPATLLLLGSGLVGMIGFRKKKEEEEV